MSNYRRFITYLFRYEGGEKKEQVGFAKIELQQNTGRVEIHLKNCKEGMVEVRPYFFAREVRIPIGTISVKNKNADGSFRFDCIRLNEEGVGFGDIKGLLIPLGPQEVVFSQWDDAEYSWRELIRSDEDNVELRLEKSEQEDKESIDYMENVKGQDEEVPSEKKQQQREELQQQDIEGAVSMQRQLQELRSKIYPFEGDVSVWAVQAQLQDLKFLPEEYWQLRNNSFVIRGYFQYGSILIGYMGDQNKWFVAVPGIYCRQEKVIAGMFGFSYFRSKNGRESTPGEFGYWYQLLDVVI